MPLWLLYLMLYLTTLSATWLVVKDMFPPIGVPRQALIKWSKRPKPEGASWQRQLLRAVIDSLIYVLTCGFCMGFWVTIPIVFWTAEYASVPLPWLTIAASRVLTGIAMSAYDRAEERWELVRRQTFLADQEMQQKYKMTFYEED